MNFFYWKLWVFFLNLSSLVKTEKKYYEFTCQDFSMIFCSFIHSIFVIIVNLCVKQLCQNIQIVFGSDAWSSWGIFQINFCVNRETPDIIFFCWRTQNKFTIKWSQIKKDVQNWTERNLDSVNKSELILFTKKNTFHIKWRRKRTVKSPMIESYAMKFSILFQ